MCFRVIFLGIFFMPHKSPISECRFFLLMLVVRLSSHSQGALRVVNRLHGNDRKRNDYSE